MKKRNAEFRKTIAKWIDDRYRIVHGTLKYKPQTKDDPMGLALIADSPLLGLASDSFPPASAAADAHHSDMRLRPRLTMLSIRERGRTKATAAATIAMVKGISPEIVHCKRP